MPDPPPRSHIPPAMPDQDDEGTPPNVWLLIWTIYIAKLATIVLVIWASHSYQTTALVAATIWPWLAVAIALGFGPLIFHLRLRRVRAKREQLKRAEWMLGAAPPSAAAHHPRHLCLPGTDCHRLTVIPSLPRLSFRFALWHDSERATPPLRSGRASAGSE